MGKSKKQMFYMILSVTLLFVDFFMLDRRKLGLGTVANMFLVGYVIEFSYWLWNRLFAGGRNGAARDIPAGCAGAFVF